MLTNETLMVNGSGLRVHLWSMIHGSWFMTTYDSRFMIENDYE